MSKLFPKDIKYLKNKRKITKVTGLNYFSARAIEEAGIDIIEQGIACVGTIGLNIEISTYEGFRCVGKSSAEAVKAYKNALVLQGLGVVWIEIECMPYKVAKEITGRLKVPTIGIGSGSGCDGQFMHSEDMLGLHNNYYPKHCKKYLDFYWDSVKALTSFKKEVSESLFPGKDNSFEIGESEFEKFRKRTVKICGLS